MKTLIIGDPHIKSTELPLHREFRTALRATVEKENPTGIVILGDVLHDHERIHCAPLNSAVNWIISLSTLAPVFVLVGNHDYVSNGQYLTNNHWMNCLKNRKNIQIVDDVIKADVGCIKNCLLVPYVPNGRFIEAIETKYCETEYTKAAVVFCHQEFHNCRMGSIISSSPDKWKQEWPLVISGHIHQRQFLRNQNIFYTGTPYQTSFGDTTEKSVVLLRNDTSGTSNRINISSITHIDLNLPRKLLLYCTLNGLSNFKVPVSTRSNTTIKLSVDCSRDEYREELKKKYVKEYVKTIQEKGIRIVVKQSRKTIAKKNKKLVEFYPHSGESFDTILNRLIAESNPNVQKEWKGL